MRATKVAFSTVFVSLGKGVVVLGYKTLNFIFLSFFLSFFFLLGKTITCCFKDTSSIIYSYEKKSV